MYDQRETKVKRYWVARWGTGHRGMASLRAPVDYPTFDLAVVYVYSDQKVGRHAVALCGDPSLGVVATKNVDDIIAAKSDCVVYGHSLRATGVAPCVELFEQLRGDACDHVDRAPMGRPHNIGGPAAVSAVTIQEGPDENGD